MVVLGGAAHVPAAEPGPLVVTVDSGRFPAGLTAIDAAGQLTLRVGEQPGQQRIVPLAELVEWGTPGEIPARAVVVLADGGLVVADVTAADGGELRAKSRWLGSLTLPRSQVAGLLVQPPTDRRRCQRLLDRIRAGAADADCVLLANRDELLGQVESLAGKTLTLRSAGSPVGVAVGKLQAVVFRRGLRGEAPVGLTVWVGLADGSRLLCRRVQLENDTLRLTLAAGLELTAAAEALIWLQPQGGRVSYLSDRPAADYRHVPLLDLAWPFHADRNTLGTWLQCGSRVYAKGLGVHSASRLTYVLDGSFRRFEADLGIDDPPAGDGGSVRFRVFVDGQPKFVSDVIRGGQPPVPMAVELAGAKRLDLVVDYADRGDQLDRADWLNARLVK